MFRGSDNFVKVFLFGCYGNQASFLKTFHHILLYLFFLFSLLDLLSRIPHSLVVFLPSTN